MIPQFTTGMRIRIVIFLLILIHPLVLTADGGWNVVADDDGITLYTRMPKGHSTAEYKAVCVVDHPIEKVGLTLSDISSYPNWFFRCTQAHKIQTWDSTDLDFLLYVAIDTPWPFRDRDAVYRVVTAIDLSIGKVSVRSRALETEHPALQNNHVHITDSELQWVLESVSVDQTRITFINRTHAAGPWGDFISGSGTRTTTMQSLKNLKAFLSRKSFT